MDKIERIRKEIEELRHDFEWEEYDLGWNNALDKVLSLLDTFEEEHVSEDLEETIDDYTRKVIERTNCLIGNQPVGEEISKAVEFGVEWQKEMMMKDAVDMVVGYWMPNGLCLNVDETENIYNIDDGDKVKVIILKDK